MSSFIAKDRGSTKRGQLHKAEIFTVDGIGYKLGSGRPLADTAYRERRECRVEACNAQFVTLVGLSSGFTFSEPLPHVMISHDHEKNRPMLLVRFS